MKKCIYHWLLIIFVWMFTGLLLFLANYQTEYFFRYYSNISNQIIYFLTRLTAIFPFSIWEIVLAFILIWLGFLLIKGLKKKQIWLSLTKIVLIFSILVCSFIQLWGLNYFAIELKDQLYEQKQSFSVEQLQQLTYYLLLQANEYAFMLPRNQQGQVIVDFEQCNQQIGLGYQKIQAQFPQFQNVNLPVKKLLSSKYFALRGITGIFICLTGEAGITDYVYPISIPFTMAHEVAHRNGIALEDEANFVAYLACKDHPDPLFSYSAYFEAFFYCANALIKADETAYLQIKPLINDQLRYDINQLYDFYDSITDTKKEEANRELYDFYLESFKVENGVDSYGDIVELLLYDYFRE